MAVLIAHQLYIYFLYTYCLYKTGNDTIKQGDSNSEVIICFVLRLRSQQILQLSKDNGFGIYLKRHFVELYIGQLFTLDNRPIYHIILNFHCKGGTS